MKAITSLVAAALLSVASYANAGLFHFTGEIENHNDVIYTYFTVENDATNVRVWTDSFQNGINFDPITALWKADGTRIDQNDDNASINPLTQTIYDSGFLVPFLAAGDYIFTVATYNNWSISTQLADGFTFDNQAPIALSQWNQPANSTNMGPHWSLWLDGVDRASNPTAVPEPTLLVLLGLGLLALGFKRARQA
ncbi:DVUA0089 family protein [Cellvibrio sp. NN19]|uniref:DVUA0089 family protein n=1 Tax=Cellvibrio chitinivorans TaxID=3102792 RepID=UPI002B40C858|nr:DVUA0089 family protein [Cellvibrio sp. NN19]